MRIAVISCKKQKQTYACEADEMYSKSFVYRAQRNFIKPAYDQYLILSSNDQSIIDEFGYLPNSEKVDSILTRALMNKN